MRKYIKIVCTIVFIAMSSALLCACSFQIGGKKMLGSRLNSDQKIANSTMDNILKTIKNEDKNKLKSMFAAQTVSCSKNIDNNIIELLAYVQGDFVSYNDWGAVNTDESMENGDRKKFLYSTYDVITTKQQYRIAIKECIIDTANDKNVGIMSFYIIRLKDDTDLKFAYRGDGNYTPGINFNIKSKIN